MNARQKAKLYKRQRDMLYEDYVASAIRCGELMDQVGERIDKIEASKVTFAYREQFDEPVEIDEDFAIKLYENITYDPDFRRAVVFEGHTDPETGKYILRAELTVVMPDMEED